MKSKYPSIFSEDQTLTPEQVEWNLEQRLQSLNDTEEQAKERKAWKMTQSPVFEGKEEAEHRKAEAKRLDMEAASHVTSLAAKEDVLKLLKDTRPMLQLESIVFGAKNSASLDKQYDKLMKNYLNSIALQSLYTKKIPKKNHSKEDWGQFKEIAQTHFERRKNELIAEKVRHDEIFNSSDDASSEEEQLPSPKTPRSKRSGTTRSVEIAKTFGEVTPAAISRSPEAAAVSDSDSDPDSDPDNDEEYFDLESEEEEKDFDPSSKTFKPVTEVLKASRVALSTHGKLGVKERIEILEDLLVAVGQLDENVSHTIKSVSFKDNGTLQYHAGAVSTFNLKGKVKSKLKQLYKGGPQKGRLK